MLSRMNSCEIPRVSGSSPQTKASECQCYGCLREAGWPFAMRRETQNQDPWQLESCKWEVTTTIRTFFCTQPQTRCTNICTNNLIQPFCQNKPSYAAQGDSAKSKITRKNSSRCRDPVIDDAPPSNSTHISRVFTPARQCRKLMVRNESWDSVASAISKHIKT